MKGILRFGRPTYLPFNMLAMSQHPVSFSNGTTTSWSETENRADFDKAKSERRGIWGCMTYTTTIAYLDSEAVLSVTIDNQDSIVTALELLHYLSICPEYL